METKICKRCGFEKSIELFNQNGQGGKQSYCKNCKGAEWSEWYARNGNRERFLKKTYEHHVKHRLANRQRLLTYLQDHPCVDCGETDPVVLVFDHVRGVKEFNISTKSATSSWKRILREIEKCEVRCSNCHLRRHACEENWYNGLINQ